MKLKYIFLTTVLTGVTFAIHPHLVQAQVCPQNNVVSPANQSRVIRQARFGYQFNIPKNYRTLAVRENGILVFDPNSFQLAQCLLKNKAPTEYPKNISIYTTPINSPNRSLTEIIKQNDPTVEKLTNIKVANQAAISYISSTLGVEKKVALLSRDRKYLITISTPFNFNQGRPTTVFNQGVFNRVVSSFAFKQ
ncbi:hypothetical protein H6G33_16570 [Calothrix sp. FACHB-1219]|uniref:hypothetical protein n=1 Tax=unclassified Calothrix TaxID=2619626 RepID=UPI001688193C|nr:MULTISPECIES: hypothetical protein [unclassified Calothrix]MBD2203047.1 hypothetical protein [Calothrix sp. FACHB-168]MBD2218648.1 hypothetical protein [Calothrix sp. FACHB-1219]